MKVTSAYANKMLKKLFDEKEFLLNKERKCSTYIAATNEEPVVPEYDFAAVCQSISDIDSKVIAIKHAINVSNCTHTLNVNGNVLTVDSALILMAQLNARKKILDSMRKLLPKQRVVERYGSQKSVPEYEYANFKIEDAESEYAAVDKLIATIQMELDKYNQTVEFDIDVEV